MKTRLVLLAAAGPSGAQFVGERHFAATSGAKGEWAILGICRRS
jgi:hypothetical protein